MNCEEELDIDGLKRSKIDGLAAADNRKVSFESDTTGVKDKNMGNKATSKMREDKRKTKKVKTNVEIEKAASKGKTIILANRDEDSKRIKLDKANGGDSRTSMMAGLMSATRRSVKNHAVGDEVRGRNCAEWNDGIAEERRSVVRMIDDAVRGSIKADKKVKSTPLQLPNYSRGKSDRAQEMRVKMREKDKYNMTYGYPDAIACSSNASKMLKKTSQSPSYGSNVKDKERRALIMKVMRMQK